MTYFDKQPCQGVAGWLLGHNFFNKRGELMPFCTRCGWAPDASPSVRELEQKVIALEHEKATAQLEVQELRDTLNLKEDAEMLSEYRYGISHEDMSQGNE